MGEMNLVSFKTSGTALQRSWAVIARTPSVAVPTAIAAGMWAITLSSIGNIDAAPGWVVLAGFLTLYVASACAVVFATAFAASAAGDSSSSAGWIVVRRNGVSIMLTLLVMGLLGGVLASVLRSFYLAWFVCAFFFMYAVPMVVTERKHWLGSIYASARLALSRIGTTLVAALLIEVIAALTLALGDAFAAVPYVGGFSQALLLQFAFSFMAIFAFEQLAGARTRSEDSQQAIVLTWGTRGASR